MPQPLYAMKFEFEPVSFWWAAAAAAALAAGAAVWGALRARRLAGGRLAFGLLALRLLACLSLLAFVLGPRLETIRASRAAACVAVVIDSSSSMDLDAGGEKRMEAALRAVAAVERAVGREHGRVFFYDVAAERRVWSRHLPTARELAGGGRGQSRMAAGLAEIGRAFRPGSLSSLVVLSDGVWPAEPDGAGLPPCFTYAAAGEAPAGMVFLVEAEAPALVSVGAAAEVKLRYFSTLAEGGRAVVTVEEFGAGREAFPVATKAGSHEAVVSLRLERPGEHFFRVSAAPGFGCLWVRLRVLERPLKIWYREMAGDADSGFLRRSLANNAGFDVIYRLDLPGGVSPANVSAPLEPDIIILGNPRAARPAAADIDLLEAHLLRGGGLLVVASAYPPDRGVLTAGPLARFLPVAGTKVELEAGGPLRRSTYPGVPALTPPAEAGWVWRIGTPRPGAAVVWETAAGAPALITTRYGLGRVALLTAGGLYRNRLAAGGDAYDRAAAGLALTLFDESSEPLALSRRIVAAGEPVEVSCRALLEPTVSYSGPAGGVAAAALSAAEEGLWAGWITTDGPAPARYDLTARIPTPAGIRVERGALLAVPPDDETAAGRPRPEALARLAAATGGRAFVRGQEEELAAAVAARVHTLPPARVPVRRILWPAWLAAATAISAVALEWFLRRRVGLR